MAADVLISCSLACIQNSVERFNPFPASLMDPIRNVHLFLKEMNRDDGKVVRAGWWLVVVMANGLRWPAALGCLRHVRPRLTVLARDVTCGRWDT